MKILMTGSEWFNSRPGGLNRYFIDLFEAMREINPGLTHGVAFGDAPPAGSSWGATGGSTIGRVVRAHVDPTTYDVVDRHFSLYGRYNQSRATPTALSIVHFHGPWAAESLAAGDRSAGSRLKKAIERIRYSRADGIVVLSDAFKRLVVEEYSIPASEVHVIPPGVKLPVFDPRLVPHPKPRILCVRRLEKRMGIDVLLRAWGMVSKAFPDAELRVIGAGSQSAALRAQAERTKGSITFLGRVSDNVLAQEYSKATATVVPSVELEGFGLIALESLAQGRAPIVTDCGGLPESVRSLDPTLIVQPGSPDALHARLSAALSGDLPSPEDCVRQAAAFGWDVAAQRHVSLYEKLANA